MKEIGSVIPIIKEAPERNDVEIIFEFKNKPCPRCGSLLVKTNACRGLSDEGWKTMLRCVTAGCGHLEGVEKKENKK